MALVCHKPYLPAILVSRTEYAFCSRRFSGRQKDSAFAQPPRMKREAVLIHVVEQESEMSDQDHTQRTAQSNFNINPQTPMASEQMIPNYIERSTYNAQIEHARKEAENKSK